MHATLVCSFMTFTRLAKEYEVSMHYTAPDPREFFTVSANKANLLSFLCDEWCENDNLKSALGPTHLYLGGGFKEETRSVVIKEGSIEDVPGTRIHTTGG